MSAVYSIFTSPNHPPVPDHLPTLIVTPHGRPAHILYTYLHTNVNRENYLLTPSEAGDLCVAKLFPPTSRGGAGGSSSHSHGGGPTGVKCEASRNLRWTISNTGIQNPVYKLTLPNPEQPQQDQPLFQVSKPNPNATWWTLFYFTYAGHLIPPKRVEFGRIQKNSPESGGGTRVAITGKTEEEKAVWKTLGESNEDMVEWIVICAALVVLDDEIISAAEKAGVGLSSGQGMRMPPGTTAGSKMRAPGPPPPLHATGSTQGVPNNRPPPSPRGYAPPPNGGPPPSRGPPPPQQAPPPQQQMRGPSPVPPINGYPLPPPMSNGHRPPQPPQQPPPRTASHQRPTYHPQQQQQQQQQQSAPQRGPPPMNGQQSHPQPGPSSAPYGQDPRSMGQKLPPRGASSMQGQGQPMPLPQQQQQQQQQQYNGDLRYQQPPPHQLPPSLQAGPPQQQGGRAPSSYRPGPPSQLAMPPPGPPAGAYGQPPNSGGSLGGAGRMLQAQVEARKLTKVQR